MRTFVFSDKTSHKFWSIELAGKAFTVTFGKVGTPGQTQKKEFADEAKAKKEHDKLVAEKLKKGYVESTVVQETPKPAGSLREALESAIVDHPEDLATHAAYADWLMEQPDAKDVALGEFIQAQVALESDTKADQTALKKREQTLLKKHRQDWVGDWADLVPSDGPEGRGQLDFPEPRPVRFVRGLPAEVVLGELSVDAARAFVRSPPTRFVRKLYLGGFKYEESGQDYTPGDDTESNRPYTEPAMTVLSRWPHFGNLRVFQLGWTSDEVYGDFCHFQCHHGAEYVHELVQKMPRLEELYLFAHRVEGHRLFALPMPNLRVLQVYHSLDYPLEKLAKNASLGRLTHLLFHPHALEDEPSLTLKGLKALARSPHLKSLTHLRLRLTVFGDAGVKEIIESGLLGRLKTLDLRHGRVSDKGARLLADAPDVRKLEHLDLSRNELTAEGISALQAVGVPLNVQHQHGSTADAEADEYHDMEFLFEGDYE